VVGEGDLLTTTQHYIKTADSAAWLNSWLSAAGTRVESTLRPHVTRERNNWQGSSSSSSSSGIYSYACSLVHSELSWWGLKKATCNCMSHICITAVTTALGHLYQLAVTTALDLSIHWQGTPSISSCNCVALHNYPEMCPPVAVVISTLPSCQTASPYSIRYLSKQPAIGTDKQPAAADVEHPTEHPVLQGC
jgi:hypothetical protein